MSSELSIIEAITEDISLLNEHPLDDYSADTLSRIAVRLASRKAGLGRYVGEANKRLWNAEKAYKVKKAEAMLHYKSEGYNSTDAKELRILYAQDAYQKFVDAKVYADRIMALSYNIHDVIDSIKSRVINEQMDKQESKV